LVCHWQSGGENAFFTDFICCQTYYASFLHSPEAKSPEIYLTAWDIFGASGSQPAGIVLAQVFEPV